MSESKPEIKPGTPFAIYAPSDMDVEQVRAEIAKTTGLGIHLRFRIGPAERISPTKTNFACEPVDEEYLIGDFKGELPTDGKTVVYVGECREPAAAA